MLTTVHTAGPGLGAGESAHEQRTRNAMGQVKQRLTAAAAAPSCGSKLDQIYWAFYHLGQAQAHVDSMSGPMEYATRALLQVLRRDVEMAWRGIRAECRL